MTKILSKEEAKKLEFFYQDYYYDKQGNIHYTEGKIYWYILPNDKYWTVIANWERILVDKKLKTLYIKEKCGIISWKLDSDYYFYYNIFEKKDILDGKRVIFAFNYTNNCVDWLEFLDDNFKWHLIINWVDILANKEVAVVKDIYDKGVYYYPENGVYNFKDKDWYWNLVRVKDYKIIFRNEMIKVFPPSDIFLFKDENGETKEERFDKYII